MPRATGDRGFTLLVAIWALALLAFLAIAVVQSTGRHAAYVRLQRDLARAEAAADAGVSLAVLDILAAREERGRTRRYALGGGPVRCLLEDGVEIAVAVADEAGKVDLNQAGERLLMALLIGLGSDRDLARRQAAAIADFRDADDIRRPDGAEAPEYRAAGLAHRPRNAPFALVDEIGLVLGVTREDTERLRLHMTVHSGVAGLDPGAVSPELREIIARGGAELGIGIGTRRDTLPAEFATASPRRVFLVRSEARTAGATFQRETIVALGDDRNAYQFRTWRRSDAPLVPDADVAAPAALPRC